MNRSAGQRYSSFRQGKEATHKSDILKQIREHPYSPFRSHHRNTPEYQPDNRQRNQRPDRPQCQYREIPHAQPQRRRPEREENTGKDDNDHGGRAEVGGQWGPVVEPGVVGVGGEVLLGGEEEGFGGAGGRRGGGGGAVDPEEESTVGQRARLRGGRTGGSGA